MENSTTETLRPTLSVQALARSYLRGRDDREFRSKTRVYFFPTGESVWDNLPNRRSRPYELYREQLAEVLCRIGWGDLKNLPRASWSQRAGCSCGCSPGFILERTLRGPDGRPIDVHVDIS